MPLVAEQVRHLEKKLFRASTATAGDRDHVAVTSPEYRMDYPSLPVAQSRGKFDAFGITREEGCSLTSSSSQVHGLRRPELCVKLSRHEEVSSIAKPDLKSEGASDCSIQGTLYALVHGSSMEASAAFIVPLDELPESVMYQTNEEYSTLQDDDTGSAKRLVVHVPKTTIGFVPILHYTISHHLEHMPILLERKITIQGATACRVAAQVRTKLTNNADMKDFTVAIAIPDAVDGSSVEIQSGNGAWNPTQRVIKFALASLAQGESFMVSAEMQLWKPITGNTLDGLVFPMLLRCSSIDDPIGDFDFQAIALDESSCSVTAASTSTFQILHRLP